MHDLSHIKKYGRGVAGRALFLMLFAGCLGTTACNHGIIPQKNTVVMRQQLMRLFPPGSSVHAAAPILKRNGFVVQWFEKSKFMEINPHMQINKMWSDIDFLFADFEKNACLFGCASERWQLAVVHKNGIIIDILISYGITGL